MKSISGIALCFAGLIVVWSLPLVGRMVRDGGEDRCAFDGVAVPRRTRVRVVDAAGATHSFCCVDCAKSFLARAASDPREIRVVDETSGDEVAASDAWFVKSRVVSFEVTGCHVHVFAKEADARRHAEAFGGLVLTGDERPLREGE